MGNIFIQSERNMPVSVRNPQKLLRFLKKLCPKLTQMTLGLMQGCRVLKTDEDYEDNQIDQMKG